MSDSKPFRQNKKISILCTFRRACNILYSRYIKFEMPLFQCCSCNLPSRSRLGRSNFPSSHFVKYLHTRSRLSTSLRACCDQITVLYFRSGLTYVTYCLSLKKVSFGKKAVQYKRMQMVSFGNDRVNIRSKVQVIVNR